MYLKNEIRRGNQIDCYTEARRIELCRKYKIKKSNCISIPKFCQALNERGQQERVRRAYRGTKDIKKQTIEIANKATKADVSVKQTAYEGMVHVSQALFPKVEQANIFAYILMGLS